MVSLSAVLFTLTLWLAVRRLLCSRTRARFLAGADTATAAATSKFAARAASLSLGGDVVPDMLPKDDASADDPSLAAVVSSVFFSLGVVAMLV